MKEKEPETRKAAIDNLTSCVSEGIMQRGIGFAILYLGDVIARIIDMKEKEMKQLEQAFNDLNGKERDKT